MNPPLKSITLGLIAAGALAGCDNISASDPVPETIPAEVYKVCIFRAVLYSMTLTAIDKGIPQTKWMRDISQEDWHAVDTIYNSPHPEETVSQLNEECRKAGIN